MADPLIRDVSDTSFWVAHHRAVETARPDALFRDPFTARLAAERGAKIATGMPAARMTGWTVVMRTCLIDDYIAIAVRNGVDVVLNLGAGLDTRPYRMQLPASLRWIEADYARIIEYKEGLLANDKPGCRLERVKIDLADRSARQQFLSDVNARAATILVLTEGVVPYLDVDEAALLADDLRAMDRVRYWIVDYFSPEALKFRRRSRMGSNMRNAPFRFEPADWHGFFRQHGWESAQIRYLSDESDRHGRPIPFPWPSKVAFLFWSLFMSKARKQELRRFAGYALLGRTGGAAK
jgi:methyltransferase (TIGR00027 family)